MTERLTIAHVLSSYGLGGQERIALELARAQRAAGHEVLVFSLAPAPDGPLAAEFVEVGVPALRVAKGRGFDVTLPFRLAAAFLARRVRIVHTHNPQPLIFGAPAARLAGARCVHTKHGANPDTARRLAMRRAASKLVASYVAVSEVTAAIARQNREVSLGRLVVVPNGIDMGRYGADAELRRSARAELHLPEDALVIGTVGRLAPEKDQMLLLDAVSTLLGDRVRLVLVGDGPERSALEARAASPFVCFTGARSDVPRLMAAFDVFALSSRTEGLPVVLLEAMATGLPIVSTAVGGIPNVIDDGVTGLLTSRDRDALSTAVRRLLEDEPLRRELGAQGRALAHRDFGIERMASRYEHLYRAALAER